MTGTVEALHVSATHTLQKFPQQRIQLLKGLGVEGDAHMGKTVKHRSRVKKDPTQANLRQVHLIAQELINELQEKGFQVQAGLMGENITTSGIDLINLPKDTILQIGATQVQITGLRNPCAQLEGIQEGLMKAVLDRDEAGHLIRKLGIMGIVLEGGSIQVKDAIQVILPAEPHIKLEKV